MTHLLRYVRAWWSVHEHLRVWLCRLVWGIRG